MHIMYWRRGFAILVLLICVVVGVDVFYLLCIFMQTPVVTSTTNPDLFQPNNDVS